MGDLVSVITPTYNRAYCLAQTLDSALRQTHANLEIVVVDDGSTDNTAALIRERYGHEKRVRYVRQENQGVAVARNRAMREARGDYLAFLDSDDLWKPWKLETQLACLNHVPCVGMIWSDMEAVRADGSPLSPRYLQTMYHAYRWFTREQLFPYAYPVGEALPHAVEELRPATFHVGDLYSPMIAGNLVHTSTVLLRRERFEKVGWFNEAFRPTGEDYDFHLRTCREGLVAYLDLPTIEYKVGMPDCLTQHTYTTALHFVQTITEAVQRDRDRIRLPRSLLKRIFAEGNAWIAEELLVRGEPRAASRYFARSLLHQKWQPRILAQLARCYLPRGVERTLLGSYRWLKSRRRQLVPS